MTQPATPLCLVDGSGYLFRAYHAMQKLATRSGEPTGAVLGVANMLNLLLKNFQPQDIVVVFDAKGKNFRHALFPAYKATRPPLPPDLAVQIPLVHDLVRAMGLPLMMVAGVEADDVIATLARQASGPVLIFSSDKDLAQLVDDRVALVDPKTGSRLGAAEVQEKYGVPPERIIDYLALMGDASDNVPGVAKVGPKTAAKWLAEYGSLDHLLACAGEIPGKAGENLRAAAPSLPLSRQLVTLRADVELPPMTLRLGAPDVAALRALYQRLEFRTLLAGLALATPEGQDMAPVDAPTPADDETILHPTPEEGQGTAQAGALPPAYETVLTQARLDAWLARLEQAEVFAFDTETTSLDYLDARVVGVSFAVQAGEAAYVPLAHDYPGAPAQLQCEAVLAALRPLLENPACAKIGQHIKYDMHVLANHGIALRGGAFDSMLQSYLVDAAATGGHGLDALAQRYLNLRTIHYEDIAGKGVKQLPFSQIGIDQAGPYAAEDADVALRLHQTLWPKLHNTGRLAQVYKELEQPLIAVLYRMERTGVLIDAPRLREHSQVLAVRLAELEREAHECAGEEFNLGSPAQLQRILYEKQGLPITSRTPKGQPSTAEEVLQELAEDYPLPRIIMRHRSLSKLRSTYTERLPRQIHPRTGRVHTSYHQAVAQTGRLSSSDPNLQNIPIRTEEGRRIRQAFIAPPGHVLIAADYSQIELRIMAHLSSDPGLLAAFAQGADVHRATAAEVFGLAPETVSKDQRRAAKAINFGLIYGMSAFGLAKQLGITRATAQAYITTYFTRYPGVKAYMDSTRAQAAHQGYVETVFGRRLYLPDIAARNAQRRQYAERTAINAPMQGSAADIIKKAMIAIDRWLQTEYPAIFPQAQGAARMIMQVHDELVFEVPEDDAERLRDELRQRMTEEIFPLRVPLEVEVGIGRNWDEAHG